MDTICIAGKEITIEQKPFVEKDIIRAKAVLVRLQHMIDTAEICSTSVVAKVIE